MKRQNAMTKVKYIVENLVDQIIPASIAYEVHYMSDNDNLDVVQNICQYLYDDTDRSDYINHALNLAKEVLYIEQPSAIPGLI